MQTGVIETTRGQQLIYLASVEHFITPHYSSLILQLFLRLPAIPSLIWVVTSAENSGNNIANCQTMHRPKNGSLCSKEHTKLISPLHLNKPKGQIACHSLLFWAFWGTPESTLFLTRSTIFLELAGEPETGL